MEGSKLNIIANISHCECSLSIFHYQKAMKNVGKVSFPIYHFRFCVKKIVKARFLFLMISFIFFNDWTKLCNFFAFHFWKKIVFFYFYF